jgi:uncharacterized protein YkwD
MALNPASHPTSWGICFLSVFISATAFPQAGWQHGDYQNISHKNFRQNPLFTQSFNLNNIDYPRLHAAIFFVTNETRVKNHRRALTFAIELERAAHLHCKYMVEQNFFSHENPFSNRRTTQDQRAKLAGIQNPFIAENIATHFGIKYKANTPIYRVDTAKGTFSYQPGGPLIPNHTYLSFAEAIVAQWMDSPPHRANLLSKDAVQLGCGAYLFRDKNFYNMPTFKVAQNFQFYRKIVPGPVTDKWP